MEKLKTLYIYVLSLVCIIGFFRIEAGAAGTNPVTMEAIKSNGNIVYNVDGDKVELYTDDLTNLYNEIDSLGQWSDSQVSSLEASIDTAKADVTDGKTLLKNTINAKASNTITADTPTWDQLNSGIGAVYTTGYNSGKADGKTTHTSTYTLTASQTGTTDLGVNHAYRYVNAANVYNKGYNSGKAYAKQSGKITVKIGVNNSVYDRANVIVYLDGVQIGSASYGDSGHGDDWSGIKTIN